MNERHLQAEIKRVIACGPVKVWSVVVTILGDLGQSRDDWVSAPLLRALTEPMGVAAQAVRVAIHRLRNDGWVESRRAGRSSEYRLSRSGWDRTEVVRPRIYSESIKPAPVFLILAAPEVAQAEMLDQLPQGAIALTSRTALAPEMADCTRWIAAGPLGTLPNWVEPALVPDDVTEELQRFALVVDGLPRPTRSQDLLADTSLRLAILHHWRRLTLRHSHLADGRMRSDWPGNLARRSVTEAFRRLQRPEIAALVSEIGDHQ